MFLVHRPEGGPETEYEFQPAKTDYNRARIAEKLYSKAAGERRTWEQFVVDATMGSMAARKVAWWVVMTDRHPMARFEDIPDFKAGELTMEYSKEELRRMRGSLESADMLDFEKKAQLEALDQAIAEARAGSDEPDPQPEADVAEVELPAGKDSKSSDEPSTS